MFKNKRQPPAASLKRRKHGLGSPIHIQMLFILINIDQYTIVVSNRTLYRALYCPGYCPFGGLPTIWTCFKDSHMYSVQYPQGSSQESSIQLTSINGLFDTYLRYVILYNRYQTLYVKHAVLYATHPILYTKQLIQSFLKHQEKQPLSLGCYF